MLVAVEVVVFRVYGERMLALSTSSLLVARVGCNNDNAALD